MGSLTILKAFVRTWAQTVTCSFKCFSFGHPSWFMGAVGYFMAMGAMAMGAMAMGAMAMGAMGFMAHGCHLSWLP